MKFGISALLLATAFSAISLGFVLATVRMVERYSGVSGGSMALAPYALFSISWWLPLVFIAFVIGARRLTLPVVVLFAMSELAAFCATWYAVAHAG